MFGEGLQEMFGGQDTDAADAAAATLAEILLLHKAWLEAHKSKD